MKFKTVVAMFTVAMFATNGAYAQDDAGKVLATVNGTPITLGEVNAVLDTLPQQVKSLDKDLTGQILEQMVGARLLETAAIEADLDKSPEVKFAYGRILQEAYLKDAIGDKLNDDLVRAKYDEYVAAFEPNDEIHARHVLLETEDEAKDIIKQLDGGADFAALAKEHSIGPSASNGGDLNYFAHNAMVKPFADTAFAMEIGTWSKEPVKTQFGWHVIKVEDRREQSPVSFDVVRGQLEQQVAQKLIGEEIDALREKAEINMMIEVKAE
ncbi:MAG: peptidylprolyl isomerase [Pseudomonadota bacterium]|nr:peptidylprolyl isomerase [Pseudomonadota bacterium]